MFHNAFSGWVIITLCSLLLVLAGVSGSAIAWGEKQTQSSQPSRQAVKEQPQSEEEPEQESRRKQDRQSDVGAGTKPDVKTEERTLLLWVAEFRRFLALVLSWPVVFLLILSYFVWSKDGADKVIGMFKHFRSVKLWGAEFVLSKKASANAKETVTTYRAQVKEEYDLRAEEHAIGKTVNKVVEQHIKPTLQGFGKTSDFRCTVHVPDILFSESLYQLVDYDREGSGRGRVWSIRRGIIGEAWRLGEDRIVGNVPTDVKKLIIEWGMTKDEAKVAGNKRTSFASFVLRDKQKTKVGVLYLDSRTRDAFGSNTAETAALSEAVQKGAEEHNLIASLSQISNELRGSGPVVRIYG